MARVRLAKPEPLVTIDDFLETYKNPYSPHAKNGSDFLVAKGVLPLTYTNPRLPDLNILVAWLLWSGSVSNYQAGISASSEEKELVREAAANLDLGTRLDTRNVIYFSEHGQWYARLFTQLGIHNSTGSREDRDAKVRHKIKLPEYVMFLLDHYQSIRRENKIIANKILADQCKVLMLSRGAFERIRGTYAITLIANSESEENVRGLAQQVLRMFNTVYPSLGLNEKSIGVRYDKYSSNYYAKITFDQDNILNAFRVYGLFDISLNRNYHILGKRVNVH